MISTSQTAILNHFDTLTAKGLKIIPVRENSKVPMCKGWSSEWDRERSRRKLEIFPDCNIGLLLGNVVDVEGDTEDANRTILRLIGEYPHPCYRSTKSIHHLFQSPDPKLRIFRIGKIEFRGHGHQSILPPSSHQGITYQWISQIGDIPPMPESLRKFYTDHRDKIHKSKPDHLRARCDVCGKSELIHQKRLQLELAAFGNLGLKWQCHGCRKVDLRRACRLIRNIRRNKGRINRLK